MDLCWLTALLGQLVSWSVCALRAVRTQFGSAFYVKEKEKKKLGRFDSFRYRKCRFGGYRPKGMLCCCFCEADLCMSVNWLNAHRREHEGRDDVMVTEAFQHIFCRHVFHKASSGVLQ